MTPGAGGPGAEPVTPATGATRRVLRAAAISGVAAVVAALAGVVRVKLYAIFLGAAGVGVISQVQNLQNVLLVLAMLGIGIGISREVARARAAGDGPAVRRILATGRGLTGGAALVLVAAVLLLAEPLSRALFGDPGWAWLLRLTAPTVLFATWTRTLSEVLNGHAEYGVNARYTMVSAGVSLVVLAALLPTLGLEGAGLAIPGAALGAWLVMGAMFRRRHRSLSRAGFGYHRSAGAILLRVGAASLILATADQVALLVVRARLIQLHGVEANGWFQGVWGLSQYVLSVAIAFQGSYSFARVNEAADDAERIAETNRTLRMTLLMMAPMTAGMILLREPMVQIFLSPEFRPSLPLFAPQAAGTLLRGAGLAAGIGALAVAPLRIWLALGLCGSGSFLVAYLLLSRDGGPLAAALAYGISGAVYLGATWVAMRRYGRLRLEPRIAGLSAASIGLLAGAAAISDGSRASYLWGAGLFAAWSMVAVSRSEVRQTLRALADRWSRR